MRSVPLSLYYLICPTCQHTFTPSMPLSQGARLIIYNDSEPSPVEDGSR